MSRALWLIQLQNLITVNIVVICNHILELPNSQSCQEILFSFKTISRMLPCLFNIVMNQHQVVVLTMLLLVLVILSSEIFFKIVTTPFNLRIPDGSPCTFVHLVTPHIKKNCVRTICSSGIQINFYPRIFSLWYQKEESSARNPF